MLQYLHESLLNVMRQSACLVSYPITVDDFAALFNCMSARLYDGTVLKQFILVGWDRSSFVCCLVHGGSTDDLHVLRISSDVVWKTRDIDLSFNTLYLLRISLCFFIVLKRDVFVCRDDSVTS